MQSGIIRRMSEAPQSGTIPMETLGDRLGRALRHGDVSSQDMADYLGVHRNTVSAYINDRTPLKAGTLRLWALRCGVDHRWLESGVAPENGPGPDGGGAVFPQYAHPYWVRAA